MRAAGQRVTAARVGYSSPRCSTALAEPTDEPSDHERGQQERDDHAHADEHIGENDSSAALDGHDARRMIASECLSTFSGADRLTGSNALNCFNGQVRLTRPPCHVDLKSLPPPAADPPGERPQVKQAQAAAFFEPEIDHFVMAITVAEATVRHTTLHRTP